MSFLDSAATLDPAQTPWAPKVPLAAAPSAPAAPAQKPVVAAMQSQAPEAKAARITPETHPHFFEAPAAAPAAGAGDDISTYMERVRKRESGGNDMAGNGTAFGRYQFTPQTWLGVAAAHPELGLRPEDIWNGEKQDQAMRAFTGDNAKVLQQNGLSADPANLNMLHFLGTGNGPKFLKEMQANPEADASRLFPLEAKYNPTIFFEKSGAPRTLTQIYDHMSSTIGGGSGAGHATPGATAQQSGAAPTPAAPLVEGRAAAETPEEDIPEAARAALGLAMKPAKPPEPTKSEEIPPAARAALGLSTQDAYQQDVHKGAYENEADKSKDPNEPPQGLIEQFGEEQARELWKDPNIRNSVAVSNATEGALPGGGVGSEVGNVSGVAQAITGLGETLGDTPLLGWTGLGDASAAGTRALRKVGDPAAQKQGLLAASLIPVGAGAAGVKGALEAGAEGGSLLARGANAAREGAVGGGVTAAIQPGGQTDSTERAKAKVENIGLGAAGGAAGAALIPAVGAVLNKVAEIPSIFRAAFSKDAERAAEELRTGVSTETGKALTAEEQKARVASVEEGVKKAELAKHDAELARIEKARQGVGGSEKVRAQQGRDTASIEDPEAAARLKTQVAATMRERVRDTERGERAAGQSEGDARAAATNQERKAAESETARQGIIEKHAAGPTKPPEEIGEEIHRTAVEDMEALKKERAEKSGFDKAVASDGGKPSVPTDKFIAQSDKILASSKSPELRDAVKGFKKELTNQPSVKGQPVTKAVSIKQAREILTTINAKIEELPPGAAHELTELRNSFMNHLEKTHPQLAEARKEYARLSRPLDVYERTGALKKATMEDPYSGKATLDATKIKGLVLNKTKEGSEALGRLIEKNPALRDSVRASYRYELFGSGAATKTPSLTQLTNFLRDNRMGLQKAGLYDEFAAMKTERDAAERAVTEAKEGVGAAKKIVSSAEDARRAALDKVAQERSLSQTAAKRVEQVPKGLATSEDAAKDAAARAKEAESRLKEQAKGFTDRKAETQKSIGELASSKVRAETARKDFKEFQSSIDTLPAKNVALAAGTAVEKLHAKDYLTDAQLDKFNRQIQEVNKKYGDTAEARAQLVKVLIAAGGLAAAGGYGVPLIRHTLPLH